MGSPTQDSILNPLQAHCHPCNFSEAARVIVTRFHDQSPPLTRNSPSVLSVHPGPVLLATLAIGNSWHPVAAVTNYHKAGSLRHKYGLAILEARSLK